MFYYNCCVYNKKKLQLTAITRKRQVLVYYYFIVPYTKNTIYYICTYYFISKILTELNSFLRIPSLFRKCIKKVSTSMLFSLVRSQIWISLSKLVTSRLRSKYGSIRAFLATMINFSLVLTSKKSTILLCMNSRTLIGMNLSDGISSLFIVWLVTVRKSKTQIRIGIFE